MHDRHIDVTALEVQRALANSFHGAESAEHAWQGSVGVGDAIAVMCRNHRGFVDTSIAAAKLGADLVYLNTAFAGPQLVGAADAVLGDLAAAEVLARHQVLARTAVDDVVP